MEHDVRKAQSRGALHGWFSCVSRRMPDDRRTDVNAAQMFGAVADAAQVWVTFVLFAVGVRFVRHWWKTRLELERMRGHSVLDPPDLKGSTLAVLLASAMFVGALVSFGVVVLEALWGASPVIVPLSAAGCTLTGYYFVWRLTQSVAQKLRIPRAPRYGTLRRWHGLTLLRASAGVFAPCAPLVVICALAAPGIDPRTDMSGWGFAYRWISAAPSLFFLGFVAVLWREAAHGKVGGDLKAARWRFLAHGTLGFAALWANLLVWPYIALHLPGTLMADHYAGLERLMEAPIFAIAGIGFFRGFAAEFRGGAADRRLCVSVGLRRLSERVSFVLDGWTVDSQNLTEDYFESSRLLQKTLSNLGVDREGTQLATDALAMRCALLGGALSETDLKRLHLHHALETRRQVHPTDVRDTRSRSTNGRLGRSLQIVPAGLPGARRSPAFPGLAAFREVFSAKATVSFLDQPARSTSSGAPNPLARASGPVVGLPLRGSAPDLPGLPLWQQAYVVVAAMSGLLSCPRAARQILDPRGKHHAHKAQRSAYKALLDLTDADPRLLRRTRAHEVLEHLFDEGLDLALDSFERIPDDPSSLEHAHASLS